MQKYRRKVLFGKIRWCLGEMFHVLARKCESSLLEGYLCKNHVHICIVIQPKYAVAKVVGFIKCKIAIHISREVQVVARNFSGQNFWARGYFVSTVGRVEKVIREYIRRQEQEEQRLEQLKLEWYSHLQAAPILSRFERLTHRKPPTLPGVADSGHGPCAWTGRQANTCRPAPARKPFSS